VSIYVTATKFANLKQLRINGDKSRQLSKYWFKKRFIIRYSTFFVHNLPLSSQRTLFAKNSPLKQPLKKAILRQRIVCNLKGEL